MGQQLFFRKNEGGGLEYELFITVHKIPKNIINHKKLYILPSRQILCKLSQWPYSSIKSQKIFRKKWAHFLARAWVFYLTGARKYKIYAATKLRLETLKYLVYFANKRGFPTSTQSPNITYLSFKKCWYCQAQKWHT